MADIPDREKHEASFSHDLGRLMIRHRRELERIAGWPPDLSRVPAEFWVRVEEDLRKQNEAALLLFFLLVTARHGVDDRTGRQLANGYVSGRAATVASRFATNTRDRVQTLQRDITTTKTVITKTAFNDRLATILGPSRADTLAVTEITAATSAGSGAAVGTLGLVSAADQWITENDARVCPICSPLHQTRRDNWSRLFPSGPPAHVNCRCWLKYSEVA
jgi:hypothetical protein